MSKILHRMTCLGVAVLTGTGEMVDTDVAEEDAEEEGDVAEEDAEDEGVAEEDAEEEDSEEEISPYAKQRLATIATNHQLLVSCGLIEAVAEVAANVKQSKRTRSSGGRASTSSVKRSKRLAEKACPSRGDGGAAGSNTTAPQQTVVPTKARKAGERGCKACGESGHYRKTCPNAATGEQCRDIETAAGGDGGSAVPGISVTSQEGGGSARGVKRPRSPPAHDQTPPGLVPRQGEKRRLSQTPPLQPPSFFVSPATPSRTAGAGGPSNLAVKAHGVVAADSMNTGHCQPGLLS